MRHISHFTSISEINPRGGWIWFMANVSNLKLSKWISYKLDTQRYNQEINRIKLNNNIYNNIQGDEIREIKPQHNYVLFTRFSFWPYVRARVVPSRNSTNQSSSRWRSNFYTSVVLLTTLNKCDSSHHTQHKNFLLLKYEKTFHK